MELIELRKLIDRIREMNPAWRCYWQSDTEIGKQCLEWASPEGFTVKFALCHCCDPSCSNYGYPGGSIRLTVVGSGKTFYEHEANTNFDESGKRSRWPQDFIVLWDYAIPIAVPLLEEIHRRKRQDRERANSERLRADADLLSKFWGKR